MNKPKLNLSLISILVLALASCGSNGHKHDEKGHHKHDANAHMHKTPIEELIKRFESPERDEYQQPEKVINYLGDLKNKTIMDIGAGSGYFSVKLLNAGAKVIAADVDERFLTYIKNRITKEKLDSTKIELRKIPFENCGLKTNEADAVLMVNVYHHIENRMAYFKNLKTGLKKEGKLYIIDFFKKEMKVGPPVEHKVSEEEIVKELKEAGFEIEEVNTTLLPNQYIVKAK